MSLQNLSLNDKVTIIIPVYNSGGTLWSVLEALLHVEYNKKLIRIVIIDGGSTDNTFSIALDFKKRYEHLFHDIIVIKFKENIGVSRARNEGAKLALPNSFLWFIDSDVVAKPKTLKNLLSILKLNPKIGAVSALYLHNNPSLPEKLRYGKYLSKICEGDLLTGAALIKWEAFARAGQFNEELGYPRGVYEDWEYGMRLRKLGYKVVVDGRDPLIHLPKNGVTAPLLNTKVSLQIRYCLKLLASYFSFNKARALYAVLKVAPLRYRLEYVLYAFTPYSFLFTLLFNIYLPIAMIVFALFTSSIYSIITYKLDFLTRIIAGPAILFSRLARASLLPLYVCYEIFKRRCLK